MATAKRKNKIEQTRTRFHGGLGVREDLLAVLGRPLSIDDTDEEFTRLYTTNGVKWGQKPFDADLVGVDYEDGPAGKGWRLLSKRGDVYLSLASGITVERIADAGTGPGKLGYLASLRRIGGRLYACGYSHQVYEHTPAGWAHRDKGLLLDEANVGRGLNDIAGSDDGELCAVGADGEIAFDAGDGWRLLDSPTHENLYAVCRTDDGRYAAAGAGGTVVLGNATGFEALSRDTRVSNLWSIAQHDGHLIVAASDGLFTVRDGGLVPFGPPAAPVHVGYKLTTAGRSLWSIGSHHVWCLADDTWTEWVCADNAP